MGRRTQSRKQTETQKFDENNISEKIGVYRLAYADFLLKKNYKVIECVRKMKKYWPSINWKVKKTQTFFESSLLKLNSNKALKRVWKTVEFSKWMTSILHNLDDDNKLISETKSQILNSKRSRIKGL